MNSRTFIIILLRVMSPFDRLEGEWSVKFGSHHKLAPWFLWRTWWKSAYEKHRFWSCDSKIARFKLARTSVHVLVWKYLKSSSERSRYNDAAAACLRHVASKRTLREWRRLTNCRESKLGKLRVFTGTFFNSWFKVVFAFQFFMDSPVIFFMNEWLQMSTN